MIETMFFLTIFCDVMVIKRIHKKYSVKQNSIDIDKIRKYVLVGLLLLL